MGAVAVVFAAAVVAVCSGAKLNVPRVLLPYSEEPTSFVLRSDSDQACFRWRSSRPELIAISHLDADPSLGCSAAVAVSLHPSARARTPWTKAQSLVTAEDVHSPGHIIRADVIVDVISSLKVVTRTHELFLEEAPEEFSVRAYDEHGNEFSTLENIIFKWSIENLKASNSRESNIRFIRFRDSAYSHEHALMQIEDSGRQGDRVLVEGIKTGSAKILVRMEANPYAGSVKPVEIPLMVVANLYLVPSSALVLPGGRVGYHAEQIKSNKIHRITLPSAQYYLTVDNQEIARVDVDRPSYITGTHLGSTEAKLRDHNMAASDDTIKSPSAEITVVAPSYITLALDPYRNWIALLGGQYEVVVEIFDSSNNAMFPSDNLVVDVQINSEYFVVREKTANGTWHFGNPVKAGTTEVRATLLGTKDDSGRLVPLAEPLVAVANLEIFDPIVLLPEISVFPWDPTQKTVSQFEYEIASGSGAAPFLWISSNKSMATVSQNGVPSVVTHQIGETTIEASMTRNSHNKGQALISVQPAAGIDLLPVPGLEAQVGSTLPVPVVIKAAFPKKDSLRPVAQCHKLPLEVVVADTKVFEDTLVRWDRKQLGTLPSEVGIACTALELRALSQGFTTLKASYSYRGPAGDVKLSKDITLSAFKPLLPIQPESGVTLLAVDSSLHLVWTGGPNPWVLSKDSHFVKLQVKDPAVVKESGRIETARAGVYAFGVQCASLGETEVTLSVGNKQSSTLPNPVVSTSTVRVICGQPDHVEMAVLDSPPTGTTRPCPLTARSGRVAALAYEDVDIRVTLLDSKGRAFDNFTSLNVKWELSDSSYGSFKAEAGTYQKSPGVNKMGFRPIGEYMQTLITKKKTGPIDVTAKISDNSYLGSKISKTLEIKLVNDGYVDESSVTVFNHPNYLATLAVREGSGYFEVVASAKNIIDSKYFDSNQTLRMRPLNDGDVILTIRDLCLKSKKNPEVNVFVSGVDKVNVITGDKVQVGNSMAAHVQLLDRHGNVIPRTDLCSVSLSSTANIVRLAPRDANNPAELDFEVHASELGDTTLVAVANSGGKRTQSAPAGVQVFAPLLLEPRNITLIIGAKFQVRHSGGPQPDANVEFVVGNSRVAKANGVGLIEAATLGSTTLVARAVGVDKQTGAGVQYSEDQISVHVVKFDGIRIEVPVSHVRVGNEVPVRAVGTDEHQNAFSFGSAVPNLRLTWDLESQGSADLVGPFHASKLNLREENNGVMRLLAKKPGKVVIKLKAKIIESLSGLDQYQLDKNAEFSDQMEVDIIEDLRVVQPALVNKEALLMSPMSKYQLKTNREGVGKIVYSVLPEKSSSGGDLPLVTVSKTGLVAASRHTGRAVVVIEDTDASGIVQLTNVLVQVKPVSYMMLRAPPAFHPHDDKTVSHLPKGFNLPLKASFHDNIGTRFDASDAAVSFRPSRFDTVILKEASGKKAVLELVRDEFTVLKATATSPQMATLHDFLILDVGRAIEPGLRQAVIVGDVIDLDNIVVGTGANASVAGKWIAEPSEMAAIDPKSGIATMLRSGHVRFSYVMSPSQRVSVDVHVKPAARVALKEFVLTAPRIPQYLPFTVHSELGNETTNFHGVRGRTDVPSGKVIASPLFRCDAKLLRQSALDLRLGDFFDVKAVFALDKQTYACQFAPKKDLFTARAALIESDVHVEVAPLFSTQVAGARADFRFVPAFHLLTPEVTATNADYASIQVQGLTSVLNEIVAEVADDTVLELGRPYFKEANILEYPVYVRSDFWSLAKRWDSHFVTLFHPATLNRANVTVNISYNNEKCTRRDFGFASIAWALLGHYESVIITIMLVFVATYFLKTNLKGLNSQKKSESMRPMQMPMSPIASPAATYTNAEQRPFLWTADRSPVYGSPTQPRSPRSLTKAQYSYSND